MKIFITFCFFLLSFLFGQGQKGGEVNTAFDESSQEKTKSRDLVQAIDGVAAVVGNGVGLAAVVADGVG